MSLSHCLESCVGRSKRYLTKLIRPGARSACAGALIFCLSASAQQSLISALSVDNSISPPQSASSQRPNLIFVGSVQASLSSYSLVQYNDNADESQLTPESDVILNTGANVGLYWAATDNSTLRLGSAIGYIEYVEHPANSGLEIAPDSALVWQVRIDDATLAFYDQFSYLQESVQEPSLANVVALPRIDNTAGLRITWEPSHWLFQLGYSYDYYISPSSLYSYLNRGSQYFFGRAAWRFAESTQSGVEASASFTSYLEANEGSIRTLSIGPFAEWQVTLATSISARVGSVASSFDSPSSGTASSTLNSYYYGLTFSNHPASYFTDNISVTRQTALGLNQGTSYVEQTAATGSFSLSITPAISLDGVILYSTGLQPLATAPLNIGGLLNGLQILEQPIINENFKYYGGGPGLTWRMTQKLSSRLMFAHWQRQSNLFTRSFSQNILSMNLVYSFW
jgi:hypothetical protein